MVVLPIVVMLTCAIGIYLVWRRHSFLSIFAVAVVIGLLFYEVRGTGHNSGALFYSQLVFLIIFLVYARYPDYPSELPKSGSNKRTEPASVMRTGPVAHRSGLEKQTSGTPIHSGRPRKDKRTV